MVGITGRAWRCATPNAHGDHEREHPEDVAAFEREFSTRERAAVRAFVDFFTFTNRFNNTWERLLPGAAARRQRLNIEH